MRKKRVILFLPEGGTGWRARRFNMNYEGIGALIRARRMELGLTQRALAEQMHMSDRAVSKWERGAGCPDIAIVPRLAALLQTDADCLLQGGVPENEKDVGNMKHTRFYMCPVCGNLITATAAADMGCCGRRLSPLEARPCDAEHAVSVECVEDESYVSLKHDMTKAHYITFMAYVTGDRVIMTRLYPEQDCAVRFPRLYGGTLYVCCRHDGLFYSRVQA